MKLLAFVALTLVCGTAAARDVGQNSRELRS